MNLAQVANLLAETFVTAWNGTTVVDQQNTIFTPPDDSWVRFYVRELASVQQTMGPAGARKFKRNCSVFVQVFGLKEGAVAGKKGGSKTVAALAEQVRRIFEGVSVQPAKFYAAKVGPLQQDRENKKYVFSLVECPFWFVEVQ